MQRRKDNKGRVLHTGESQRKDLRYQYRYTDLHGKRAVIYDTDLNNLRKKEKKIQKMLDEGLDFAAGEITVCELIARNINLKKGVREGTKARYRSTLNIISGTNLGAMKIANVKVSDIKQWVLDLSDEGKSYGTIANFRAVVSSAFQMAYEENAVRRNPCKFKLSDVVPNDAKKRCALTDEEQERFFSFVQSSKIYSFYYDYFAILLQTGMRVSEFCGITKNDLDFKNRRVKIDHQLLSPVSGGGYHIVPPKTAAGVRYIPMTFEAYACFKRLLARHAEMKMEHIVDGYTGFLVVSKGGSLVDRTEMLRVVSAAVNRYNKLYPETPLPKITPHVFRHTFCTNLARRGIDAKSLQYLMGHSTVHMTLNVYTHSRYEDAAEAMKTVLSKDPDTEEQSV